MSIHVGQLVSWYYNTVEMAGVVTALTTIRGVPYAVVDPLQSFLTLAKPVKDLTPFMAAKGTEGRP